MSRFSIRYILFVVVLLLWALLPVLSACGGDGGDDDDDDNDDDDNNDDDNNDDDNNDDNNDDVEPNLAVQNLLDEYVAFTGEPGIAVAWSRSDNQMNTKSSGLSDLLLEIPLDENSIFRIGSETKPFVAAVTMQLVDEGMIGLDDPVQVYLPEYTQWPTLTVRHLLSMRSGILDYLNSTDFWLYALFRMGEPFSPDQLVQYAMNLDPAFPPGEGCDYSNTNYVLLGMIIQRVTDQAIYDVFQERIFTPLDLSSTYLDLTGQVTSNLAHGYADVELAGPLMNIDDSLLELINLVAPQFAVEGTLIDPTYMIHPTFAWTAAGMVSTPAELTTFMRAWVQGELASEDAMEEVFDFGECAILGEGVLYGLGLERNETEFGGAVGHGGLHFGYATTAYHVVDSDLTYAVTNNYLPEQFWYIRNELLAAMHDPYLPASETCRPPEGFLEETGENLLQVRYRGPVIDINGESSGEETGLSGTRMRLDGVWRAYNGYGAYSYVSGSYLTVESIGPERGDEWDSRTMSLDLAGELFDLLDETGYAEITNDRFDLFSSLLSDIDEDFQPDHMRVCFHAVPDPSGSSKFFVCETDPANAEPGDMVKVFANIPMTRDETTISQYLSQFGMAPCICMDPEWNWEPC